MKLTKVGRKTIAAWKAHPRYISSCGGTRSGKTYSILQTFIIALVEEVNLGKPATINSVVSESMRRTRREVNRDSSSASTAWVPNPRSESAARLQAGQMSGRRKE